MLCLRPSKSKHLVRIFSSRNIFLFHTMEINKSNFEEGLTAFNSSLSSPSCRFIAMDTEFTGLSVSSSSREEYIDTLEERYTKLRQVGKSFIVNQMGLTLVHEKDGVWKTETFTFYLFPRPYDALDNRFMCQASSLEYLATHGFDFNKFIKDGISYMTRKSQKKMKEKMSKAIKNKKSPSRNITVDTKSDKMFVSAITEQMKAFMENEDEELIITESNSFRRLLIHHIVSSKCKGLFSEKFEKNTLRILKLSPEEIKERNDKKVEELESALSEAIGFSRVIELLIEKQLPIVGHNALLDLLYTYHQFIDELPENLSEFKEKISQAFPHVYDTKHIVRTSPLDEKFTSSALGALYDDFNENITAVNFSELWEEQFDEMPAKQQAHDAGFDSFMTAMVFLGAASSAEDEVEWTIPTKFTNTLPLSKLAPFENKLNLMFSDASALDLSDTHQIVDRSNAYAVHPPKDEEGKNVSTKYNFYELFDKQEIFKVLRPRNYESPWIVFLKNPLTCLEMTSFEKEHKESSMESYNAYVTSCEAKKNQVEESTGYCVIC